MKTTSFIPSHPIVRNTFAALTSLTLMVCAFAVRAGDDGYVAHEWGTFTSIQGGDGVLQNWNGVATADLPPFVYNQAHPGLRRFFSAYAFGKGGLSALQRMETPVIYFYAKKPLTLDLSVQFPKGTMTEWFPQAAEVGPSLRLPGPVVAALDNAASRAGLNSNPTLATRLTDSPVTNNVIHWKNFEVLPAEQHGDLASQLPTDTKGSHYFAARTKDAAFIRVNSLEPTNPAPELEKFLFYRGVGNFQTPLTVTMNEQNQITVTNTGTAPLKHLFAISIKGDHASVVPLGNLRPRQILDTRLDTSSQPAATVMPELRRQMAAALEAEGLYASEAEAMVNTWRDAWFEDQGVRILYILPRTWTDSTLPITMAPMPRELTRVMVGRAEIITPATMELLCKCIDGFRQSDPAIKQNALNEFKAMRLGRFTTVAISLAAAQKKNPKLYDYGAELIKAAQSVATSAEAAQPARRLAATGG